MEFEGRPPVSFLSGFFQHGLRELEERLEKNSLSLENHKRESEARQGDLQLLQEIHAEFRGYRDRLERVQRVHEECVGSHEALAFLLAQFKSNVNPTKHYNLAEKAALHRQVMAEAAKLEKFTKRVQEELDILDQSRLSRIYTEFGRTLVAVSRRRMEVLNLLLTKGRKIFISHFYLLEDHLRPVQALQTPPSLGLLHETLELNSNLKSHVRSLKM